jgi:NRPS condensation-like uncharacterized protein
MGIRYGRISKGEVKWFNVSHCECDGIGGFARLLREHGAELLKLPETNHPCRGIFSPLWRLFRNRNRDTTSAKRSDWLPSIPTVNNTPKKIAWHLFTKDETQTIIHRCREQKITVNSHLLHCLDQSIRPEIRSPEKKITWMIPVNLRGDIRYPDDTQNHVSCVEVKIAADDSTQTIHQQILQRLERGEHRANFLLLTIGGILSHQAKVNFLTKDRKNPDGNIGSFSNLGAWNLDDQKHSEDGWIFCPPIVTGQRLGAGCVTFNGRLGIATQGDPTTSRMNHWVELIQNS